MAGYNKIVPGIVDSSIWDADAEVRIVWITFIATKDVDGFVKGTPQSMARKANVSLEKAQEAIKIFENPDPLSSTPDYEGRRIKRVPGGWKVLNSDKYREEGMTEAKREYWRKKKAERRARERSKKDDVQDMSETSIGPHVSVSASASVFEEGECEGEIKNGESGGGSDKSLYGLIVDVLGEDVIKRERWLQLRRGYPAVSDDEIKPMIYTASERLQDGDLPKKNIYAYLAKAISSKEVELRKDGMIANNGRRILSPQEQDSARRDAMARETIEETRARVMRECG